MQVEKLLQLKNLSEQICLGCGICAIFYVNSFCKGRKKKKNNNNNNNNKRTYSINNLSFWRIRRADVGLASCLHHLIQSLSVGGPKTSNFAKVSGVFLFKDQAEGCHCKIRGSLFRGISESFKMTI